MKQLKQLLFIAISIGITSYTSHAQYNFNYAAIFNGSNSYIAVPAGTGVDPVSSVSIEAWVYLLSYSSTGNFQTIYGKNYQTSNSLFILGAGSGGTNGKIRFYAKGGSFFESNGSVPLNTWTHVCATYDGSNTKIYLNGNLDASSTAITGLIGTNTDSVFIGCDREGAARNYFLNGYLDEVRLWSTAKTLADVQRDMYVSLGTLSAGGIYGGILSAWRMNNNAIDEGGNNFNNGFTRNISFMDLRQKPVNYADYNGTLVLNGTTDYCASIAFASAYSSPNAITLEAWIKRDTTGTQPVSENIVNRSGGASRYNYAIFIQGGTLVFQINDGSFTLISPSMAALNLARWNHVAATYNASTGRAILYLNGDSIAASVFSGNPLINDDAGDNIFVGGIGASNFSANKFKGQIDEVRIWKNMVRTSSEIKANMYNNLNFTTPSLPSNLIDFGFDGMNYNTKTAPGNVDAYLFFFGSAYMSSAHQQNDATPVSPILRDDASGFASTNYFSSTKRYFIPDNNTPVTDSVFIPSGGLITNVKLFALINHTRVSDLFITLIAPNGTSANIFTNSGGSSSNDIMTIFSDAADSLPGALSNGGFRAPFSPLVKPNNPLSVFNNINRQGWWKLRITDNAGGDIGFVNGWGVQANIVTGTQQNTEFTDRFELSQNYPNPFNPVTNIKYTLPKDADVRITVYDILGKEISVPLNGFKKAGNYELTFDGTNLSSGIYFYKIEASDFKDIKKMTLIK